jgi:haloacetate dehalogenase
MPALAKIERRAFIGAVTAASGAALSSAVLSRRAVAQAADPGASGASHDFETASIDTGDNEIFIRHYGNGPPLLMVHGFPRTSLMWRELAPKLAGDRTVICVDLRGYGRSGAPASTEDHYPIQSGPWRTNS